MVHQVHLKQSSLLFLSRQLRLQQVQGVVTDTTLICKDEEKITAHRAILATHWVWAFFMRGLDWWGEEWVIIMDTHSKLEVEKWVSEAYDNIGVKNEQLQHSNPKKYNGSNSEPVKTELPENLNRMDVLNNGMVDDIDVDEIDRKDSNDDTIINIKQCLDLENLVKQQLILSQNESPASGRLKLKVMKDDLFNSCLQALETRFENAPEKVRGLPLHGFVFTDVNIISLAKAQVKKQIVERGKVSKVSTYSCSVSECDFTSDDNHRFVVMHVMSSHMEQKAFKCKDCGRTFDLKDRAYSHIKRVHVDKTIKGLIAENLKVDTTCKLCSQVYKSLDGLREHMKNIHDKQTDVKCPECTFVSREYLEVMKHRRNVHGFGHRSCDICGKQLSSQNSLDHHLANTHGNGSFPCDGCERIFKTKRAMDDHRQRKHEEKTFVCDVCGARFYKPFAVKKHKQSHGNDYPYQCTICDKRCREAGKLKQHMYKHTGERPYECKQCPSTFNRSEALGRHTKVVHSGIRAYPCEICSFRGGQPYDLVRHLKSVHDIDTGAHKQELKISS